MNKKLKKYFINISFVKNCKKIYFMQVEYSFIDKI